MQIDAALGRILVDLFAVAVGLAPIFYSHPRQAVFALLRLAIALALSVGLLGLEDGTADGLRQWFGRTLDIAGLWRGGAGGSAGLENLEV